MSEPTSESSAPKVYLAGPMFSDADRKAQQEIAGTLRAAGFEPYLPQEDGIEVVAVMDRIRNPLFAKPNEVLEVTAFARKLVFALDVFQCLHRCHAVVLNLDGRVPDEGAVMEASLAWSANKPVVIYKTTFITELGGLDNPMVSGLGMQWASVKELKQLPGEVDRAMARSQWSRDDECTPGPHVDAVIKLGAEVWARMDEVRAITALEAKDIPAAVQAFREDLREFLEAANLWDPPVPEGMQHTL